MIVWVAWLILNTSSFTIAQIGSVSMYELLYGDLTKLENWFELPFNTSYNENASTSEPDPPKRKPFAEWLKKVDDFNEIPNPGNHFDIQDFNKANMELKNFTRKSHYETFWYDYDIDDYYLKNIHERKKKMMLLMANMQFLIHTRYKINMAVGIRNVIKHDKRYKLGYLFARLRRLQVAQRKMAAIATSNRLNYDHNSLLTLLRLYEKTARLDVDMRDTCYMIKMVYAEKSVIDRLY